MMLYTIFVYDVTMLLQFGITNLKSFVAKGFLVNLQSKCNRYFHIIKHI